MTQRPTEHDDEPIEVPYRVAGRPDVALVPVESMLDGMRSLGDRLAELSARNEALATEVGTLRERTGHQETTIGRLEAERDQAARERDALRDDVERLRAVPAPLDETGGDDEMRPVTEALMLRWRRWFRRMTAGP